MSSLKSRVKSAKAVLTFSPDVELSLRHRCRNLKCRCKLPVPTDNPRNSFCTRGCFASFYRSKCLVCEAPFKRTREDQTTCGRAKCQTALRRDRAHFYGKWGHHPSLDVSEPSGNPIESGIKTAHKLDRPWRQVAGSPMSSEALRLTAVGPEQATRLEREQKALVEAHLHDPDPTRAAPREELYVEAVKRGILGRTCGRLPTTSATVSRWEPCDHPAAVPDIPEFLRRGVV
jgi:hypothetical protein